ncbi:hypothetical protein ACFXG4_34225 [Nocardia sp. NPDC059246]|uniref:hypothetical protein n=1 Tax=unclassified Nocardia TaxID=2637762 RepID=UPI0036C9BCBE
MLLLIVHGELPMIDAAIFADTGWEPEAVYRHLDRLEREIAVPAGIPLYRVSNGDIRRDALDPQTRFAQMPLYVLGPDGGHGMLRRQCTDVYKITPIRRKVRELLGYPATRRVPVGVYAEQLVGISLDESWRASRADYDVSYSRSRFPLLFLPGGTGRTARGWPRTDC